MPDGLRLVKWVDWQKPAIRAATRDRKDDPRLRRRLSFVALAVDFTGADFQAFAAEVGGRSAETFWTRTIQYVGKEAATTGFLLGITRRNFAQVVSRPHDTVKPGTAAKVFDALVSSGLAVVEKSDPVPGPVPGGCTDPVPVQYTHPAPAREGPSESHQGVTAKSCDRVCTGSATSEVEVEEEVRTVVDSDVAVEDSRARPAAQPPNGHGPPKGGGCSACRDGLVVRPGERRRTCGCPRGLERRLANAKARAEEHAQARRAETARREARLGRRGSEPLATVAARVRAGLRPAGVPP